MSEKKKKRGLTDREPTGLLGRIAAALSPGKAAAPDKADDIAPPMVEPESNKDDYADWDDDDDGEVTIVSFSDFD